MDDKLCACDDAEEGQLCECRCDSCIECNCNPDVCRCNCHSNNEMFKSQKDFE